QMHHGDAPRQIREQRLLLAWHPLRHAPTAVLLPPHFLNRHDGRPPALTTCTVASHGAAKPPRARQRLCRLEQLVGGCELELVEPGVFAAPCEELVVRAELGDAALHED